MGHLVETESDSDTEVDTEMDTGWDTDLESVEVVAEWQQEPEVDLDSEMDGMLARKQTLYHLTTK